MLIRSVGSSAEEFATVSDPEIAHSALPHRVNDADEHSTPSHTAYERYIDPDKRDNRN